MPLNEAETRTTDAMSAGTGARPRTRLRQAAGEAPSFRTDIPYSPGRIRAVERRPCTWRTVYSVILDEVPDFVPGDSVGLLVPNEAELVDGLFAQCGLEDTPVSIDRDGRHGFSYTGSLRDFFLNHFDFRTLPKKAFLRALARTSPRRAELERLCTREAAGDYFAIAAAGTTVLDVMRIFGCRPGLDVLVEHGELIRPRFFSLTNRRGDRAAILVGVLDRGHVSSFVARCTPGASVRWYVRPNRLMRMTAAPHLLCICTGTGIAPFLSFMRNRAPGQRVLVLYGCRNVEDDLSEGVPGVFRVLSSAGRYVTDILREDTGDVGLFLRESDVFVCGSRVVQRSVLGILRTSSAAGRLFFDDWR